MSDEKWWLGLVARTFAKMCDEKWWLGLVARTFAKMCPELGVEKKALSAHHKSHHTDKFMGHATVAYLFEDTPENGGIEFLVGFLCCHRTIKWRKGLLSNSQRRTL
jgi:hypothetical protein